MYSSSRNDVPRVAQRYGTIAAHTWRRASVLKKIWKDKLLSYNCLFALLIVIILIVYIVFVILIKIDFNSLQFQIESYTI